jgi:hypothetical protein
MNPIDDPCTGDKKLDRHARFLADTIHREAVQTRLILETILAQLMDLRSQEDKKCLDATLATAKRQAARLKRLAASMARLDNETAP